MTVRLRFDWPDGLALDVTSHRAEWQERDGEPRREWGAEGGFRVVATVQPGAERLWHIGVTGLHRRITAHDPTPPGVFDHKLLLDQLKDAVASFVVDDRAEAVLVTDGDALRKAIGPPPKVREAQPVVAGVFDRMTTDAALLQQAQQFWNPCVSTWSGHDLEPGVPKLLAVDHPMPIVGGHAVRMDVELLCERVADGLAHLVARSRIDPEHLRQVSQAVATPGTGTKILDADLVTVAMAVVAPDTLIPVRATVVAGRKMTIATRDGATTEVMGQETRSWSFAAVSDA